MIPDAGIDWDACIGLLLQAMQSLQQGLLHVLAALDATRDIDGQPAWPFALRLSGEVMLIDRSVARALLAALAYSAAALLLAALACAWKRARIPLLLAGGALLLFTPWPDAALFTAPAAPTSFHVSPTGFSASAIVRGERLYTQQCIACHGADGRGNTPLGLSLPVAPPNLSSGLLWRRSDGDIFWSLQHGKGGMPAFATRISVADSWALIDYMKANAAGVGIAATGAWPRPVALPDIALACRTPGAPGTPDTTRLSQWHGQRVRLVVAESGKAPPTEDPRLQSVLLDGAAASADSVGAIACANNQRDTLRAIAIITGTPEDKLPGTQLLADRDGWLRARNAGGEWSPDDMLCRSTTAVEGAGSGAGNAAGGMDQLIAAMDADPVRFAKGGFFTHRQR
ncbi:cytochrome c [Herbaspirillum sp. SJZ130]|uniref:c-type cytochrome n=1 Tax=unclassified Herbaspirillum TaxID=2624150 RepID=UPI00116909CE|nr:cbb3-type cytochrome c oxidase subunit III [Herbaspirillum sp. SJZ130]TQK14794.1 cbb3-type cytochrome c oxidase subunit III [Herbaspirillum sp. SJZ106]